MPFVAIATLSGRPGTWGDEVGESADMTAAQEGRSGPNPIICFAGVDWWYHNRAHSDVQLMLRVARTRPVLLVNSIGMRMPLPGRVSQPFRRVLRKLGSLLHFVRSPIPELANFRVFSPLAVPLFNSHRGRNANASMIRGQISLVSTCLGLKQPDYFVTVPTAWDVVRPMRRSRVIYNRSDKHSEFAGVRADSIRSLERALLREADIVLYASHELMREEAPTTGGRAIFLDHGVDLELFRRSGDLEAAELRDIARPRVGFLGSLRDRIVDFDLLEALAVGCPDVQLVLVGDSDLPMTRLTRHDNVHWVRQQPHVRIPEFGSGLDVAIMPFLDNDWVRYCNPIKMKEYLALGLPIVSTPFPEAEFYPELLRIRRGRTAFIEGVRQSLEDGGPGDPGSRRAAVADRSWDRVSASLVELLNGNGACDPGY